MRRRYRWADIAATARSKPGVWRQHPDLIAVTEHTYRHIRRRVAELDPDDGGTFRFRRGHAGIDRLGRTIFDLKVAYIPKENHVEQQ